MKSKITLLTILSASVANAAVVVTEDFTYADGVLNGSNNSGTGWTGAWGASSPGQGEFEIVSNEAIFKGDGTNQTINTHSRAFGSAYTIDANTTLTLSFDLIVNETQLGRGIGLHLTDSTNSSKIFIGKELNGEYGAHADIDIGGDTYADTGATGSMAVVATITSDGTDTFVSVSANGGVAGTGTIAGTQFIFDGLDAVGYHRSTATNGVDNISIDVTVAPVPEPSSTALIGLGGLALLLRRRK